MIWNRFFFSFSFLFIKWETVESTWSMNRKASYWIVRAKNADIQFCHLIKNLEEH